MKKMASSKKEPDLVKVYEEKRPLYVEYSERLHDLICGLLKAEKFFPATTEKRAKEVDSLRRHLQGIEKDTVNTLDDVNDLAGVRVVTVVPKDVDVVVSILRKAFHSGPKSEFYVKPHDETTLGETAFGYRATHVYFKLNGKRAGLSEWKKFKGLVAEVQIKTFLQHSWASLEHELIYKPVGDSQELSHSARAPIRREFTRFAVLIEVVDERLDTIEKTHARIVRDYRNLETRVKRGRAGPEKLTAVSLDLFIKNKKDGLATVVKAAGDAGFDRSVKKPGSLEDFVKCATACGISTIADFTKFLDGTNGRKKDLVDIYKEAFEKRQFKPAAFGFDVLIFLLALDHKPAFERFRKSDYKEEIKDAVAAVRALKTQPKTQQNKK